MESKLIPLKTLVATRAPLTERMAPVQSATILHDHEHGAISSYFLPKRGLHQSVYSSAKNAHVYDARDVPYRSKEPKPLTAEEPLPFHATTTKSVTGLLDKDRRQDFFSKMKQMEKEDDAARQGVQCAATRSGAAKTLRSVEMIRKRETDPQCQPPADCYKRVGTRTPNGIPATTLTEAIRYTYVSPLTCNQMEFVPPMKILPTTLEQAHGVQRRAISDASRSKDMFEGTPKSRADVLPGFMGHVPCSDKNVARLHVGHDTLRQHAKNTAGAGERTNPVRSPVSRMRTMQGFYLEQCVGSADERSMNKILFGKKTAVLN